MITYTLYASHELPSAQIREQSFFAQACCQDASLSVKSNITTGIDWLYGPLRVVGGGKLSPQGHARGFEMQEDANCLVTIKFRKSWAERLA